MTPRCLIFLIVLFLSAMSVSANANLLAKPTAVIPSTTTQVLLGGGSTQISTGSDRHWPLASTSTVLSAPIRSGVMPFPGQIFGFKFQYDGIISGSQTYTATIMINGVASAAGCSVTAAGVVGSVTICTWSGIPVRFAAGDYVEVDGHPPATNIPTTAYVSHAVLIQPDTPNNTVLMAGANTAAFGTTINAPTGTPIGSANNPAAVTSISRRHGTVPDSGTISSFYVSTNAPGTIGSGDKYDFTVLKDGVSALPCTASILEIATTCNSGANGPVSVAGPSGSIAGDDVEFQATPGNASGTFTGIASNAGLGLLYIPATAGHYALPMTTSTAASGTSTLYFSPTWSNGPLLTTEASVATVTYAQTIKKFVVNVLQAPGTAGSGKSWRVRFRVNLADAVDSLGNTLGCDINETAKSCVATPAGTMAVNDNDRIDYALIPNGNTTIWPGGVQPAAPTSASLGISALATR